jgi:D-sedoheptulose 7-phosphate isomerase
MKSNKFLFKDYSKKISSALEKVEQSQVDQLFNHIDSLIGSNSYIYLLGNGGSQANAHHISGDFIKTFSMVGLKLKFSCLADNVCHLTAAANDLSFEDSYSILVDNIIDKDDFIIYLSGSGNSLNLVKCARKARNSGIRQSAIIGYSGGALKEIVDYPVHVNYDDMEISEDIQLSIFHYIKQRLMEKYIDVFNEVDIYKYRKRTEEDLIS